MSYYVYIARCADGTLYTGLTTDLTAREESHNSGLGAKYTRSRRPIEVVYSESFPDRSTASRREYEIKQLSRERKLRIIDIHASP